MFRVGFRMWRGFNGDWNDARIRLSELPESLWKVPELPVHHRIPFSKYSSKNPLLGSSIHSERIFVFRYASHSSVQLYGYRGMHPSRRTGFALIW